VPTFAAQVGPALQRLLKDGDAIGRHFDDIAKVCMQLSCQQ
jgi:hypothetical protein